MGKEFGLFKKALEIRLNKTDALSLTTQTMLLDEESGISKDDQKDIIQEIDKIASKSKIKVTPELFNIKALKQGFGLPILVNALATIILTASILGLITWFRGNREQIISAGNFEVMQGNSIVEQIKKEAEEELERKNKEILSIQNSLSEVNSELDDLKTNMEQRIADRENELRTAYNDEIEAEKERLRQAGYTGTDLDTQIKVFAAKKETEYQSSIAEIKKEEEAKIAALEQSKLEYATRLQQAQEDLKTKEEELKSRQSEVEREIANLKEQKEKFDIINSQILGYYNNIRTQMNANNLNNAKTQLTNLRSFLDDPNVISQPDILARRDVELFIIDSIDRLISREQQKESADTKSLLAQANLLTEIRATVIEANNAYKAGNKVKAEKYYLDALQLIPEVYQSHNYFITKMEDVEKYRETQVNKYLNTANVQYNNKQYSGSLVSYTKAIEFLPGNKNTEQIITQIKSAGYYLEEDKTQQINSKEAENKLNQAKKSIEQKKYNDAINTLLALVHDFPRSLQVEEALSLIDKAVRLKDEEVKSNVAVIGATGGANVAALKEYQQEIASLKQSLQDKEQEMALLKNKANLKEGTTIVDEKDLNMLKVISTDVREAQGSYYRYKQAEDKIIKNGTTSEYVEGKSYLDEFLASDKMENIFPGLISRIKRYDHAFEQMGRNSALKYAATIVNQLAGYKTTSERLSFIDQKIKEASRDPLMVALLNGLKRLLGE